METPVFEPLPAGPGHYETRNRWERRATDAIGDHHADFPDEPAWNEGGAGCRTCRDAALADYRARNNANNSVRDAGLREIVADSPREPATPPRAFDYISRRGVTRAFWLAVVVAICWRGYHDVQDLRAFTADYGTVLAENIQEITWDAVSFALRLVGPIALVFLGVALAYDLVATPVARARTNGYVRRDSGWRARLREQIDANHASASSRGEIWQPDAAVEAALSRPAPSADNGDGALSRARTVSGGAVKFAFWLFALGLACHTVLSNL